MSIVRGNKTLQSRRKLKAAVRIPVAASFMMFAVAAAVHADTPYYFAGGNNGIWDNGVTADWASPTQGTLPLVNWANSSTADAYFTSIEQVNVNASVVANALNFSSSGASAVTFSGNGMITANQIINTVANQNLTFDVPLNSTGQFVIQGVPFGTSNSKGVTLNATTNEFDGGLLLTGGSVYFNLGNPAPRYVASASNAGLLPYPFTSYQGNVPGSSAQNSQVLLTNISGSSPNFYPAITVAGNGTTITLPSVYTNDYVLPNPIVLNPNQVNPSTFYTNLGAGSVLDSGSVTTGPFPYYAAMNFGGQISGNGNVVIGNDFYGGGGKGYTIFSNTGNNYTGNTIINNNGQNYLTFQVGAAGAVPATTNLVFGGQSIGVAISDPSFTKKQVGAFDLNGFDVTVKSLSSDLSSSVFALGITAVNNHGIDPLLASGPHATDGTHTSTLTIDSQGALNNTFFTGNITDGTDFLTQITTNSTAGVYTGPASTNFYAPAYFNATANGLKVALTLAVSNRGVLTLTGSNGGKAPDYGYSGGTTVSGGKFYVNGLLSAPANNSSSQVLVTTPTLASGFTALLGGTGTINSDIHLQSGATLEPGSTPLLGATGAYNSGSSFNAAPSTFGLGRLTVTNLTMDGGSQINSRINDGSNAAVAGSGYGILTFSSSGTFTEAASVTAADPIYVHPVGTFAGFLNYTTSTWALATFPANFTNLSTSVATGLIDLDTRNGYTPVATALLSGGTFALSATGSVLDLVFVPSPTVVAVKYSGPSVGTWNTAASNNVWTDLVHGTGTTSYADPANVVFGTPTANTTITIDAAGVSPSTVTFNNASASSGTAVSYTVGGGSINGGTALSFGGNGHLILTSSNAYSGGTIISGGGTLETQASGALGSGDVTLSNGIWSTTTTSQTYSVNVQVLGNSPTVSTIQTATTGGLTLLGNIYGTGSFTKAGAGTLTLAGILGQSGDLNVNAGSLVVTGTASYGGNTSVAAGAAVEFNVAQNTQFSFSPSLNVAGLLVIDNTAALSFSPGTYTCTGTLVLQGSGSSIQGAAGVLGGPAVSISNAILLNPASTPNFITYIGMAGQGNRFWLQNAISGNSDVYFAAGPGQSDGASIDLYSASTYTGNTYMDFSKSDVLTLHANNALPSTTLLTWGVSGGGAGFVDLNGHTLTVAGIQTDGKSGGLEDTAGGGLLVVSGSSNCTFDASITTFLNITVALQNNAYLTLSYNGLNNGGPSQGNTYDGVTTVSSGVLRLSNPFAISPYQNMTLNGGVIELKGDNFTDGSFTMYLSAGTADPFNNPVTPGTQGYVQLTGGASGFSAYGSAPVMINLNGGGTVAWGTSTFNPSTLVLNQSTATQAITFANSLDFGGATRTIAVNSTAAGATATLSGNLLNNGGLIKTGLGSLILTAPANYTGSTAIMAGALQFGGSTSHSIGGVSGAGTLIVDAGATLTSDGVNLLNGTWIVNGSHVIRSSGGGGAYAMYAAGNGAARLSGTSEVSNLTFGAGANLDIRNNALIIEATTGTKAALLASIAGDIGTGAITSSTAASNPAYGLEVVDNAALGATHFGGLTVDSNSIIVTQALLGDANLDGVVNPSDLLIWANNFNNTGVYAVTGGDFNLDGVVNPTDLLIWANHFNNSIVGSGVPSIAAGGTVATPEPASLALLGLGAAGMLIRRKRRSVVC